MLGVVGHGDGFVDEQHRDAVLDAVGAAQPRVVEQLGCTVLFAQALISDQQERPAVLRAYQDAQQFFVEHDAGSGAERLVDRRAATAAENYARAVSGSRHSWWRTADAEPGLGLLLLLLRHRLRLELALVGDRLL